MLYTGLPLDAQELGWTRNSNEDEKEPEIRKEPEIHSLQGHRNRKLYTGLPLDALSYGIWNDAFWREFILIVQFPTSTRRAPGSGTNQTKTIQEIVRADNNGVAGLHDPHPRVIAA